MLPIGARLEHRSKALDVLAVAIIGTMFEQAQLDNAERQEHGLWRALRQTCFKSFPSKGSISARSLRRRSIKSRSSSRRSRCPVPTGAAGCRGAAYEARALYGIWATAPYLHNGSVPNLWELLTPAKRRKATMVGSRVFDPKHVGYVTDQSPSKNGTFVTDPNNANGNGNGGHEFGTNLSEAERWAIIEYLKGFRA